jgi:hypothetical protein
MRVLDNHEVYILCYVILHGEKFVQKWDKFQVRIIKIKGFNDPNLIWNRY